MYLNSLGKFAINYQTAHYSSSHMNPINKLCTAMVNTGLAATNDILQLSLRLRHKLKCQDLQSKYVEKNLTLLSSDSNRNPSPVFFNLFVAAEPWTSVEVAHRTPCIDPCVQRRTRSWSYSVYGLISLADQSPCEDDKGKDDQY